MRNRRPEVLDSESLQADVMRFLAIIAFCLIAILALVEKLPDTPVTEISGQLEEPEQVQVATLDIEPEKPEVIVNQVSITPPEQESEIDQRLVNEIVPTAAPEPEETAQLSLQFESDAAFLGLIHAGDVVLYSRINGEHFLMDSMFRLGEAQPAGELYEIFPDSLPIEVRRVVDRRGEVEQYFVQLPAVTKGQIADLSRQYRERGGVLVIGAGGEVQYEI